MLLPLFDVLLAAKLELSIFFFAIAVHILLFRNRLPQTVARSNKGVKTGTVERKEPRSPSSRELASALLRELRPVVRSGAKSSEIQGTIRSVLAKQKASCSASGSALASVLECFQVPNAELISAARSFLAPLPGNSKLAAEGYPTEAPALQYSKDLSAFSESHHILQDFFDGDIKEEVQFEHDPDCDQYPEVYQAWKAAGQEDNCPTVATCPSQMKWAAGFGGKANALRAAKLALALSLATDADPARLATIAGNYPMFAGLCAASGIEVQG